MKTLRNIVQIVFFLAFGILPVNAVVTDSTDVKVCELNDSLEIQITAYKIETQLTFLMQGLNIRVEQPDTVTLCFPSGPMVKDKVKRHPNEVKAMLATQRKRQEEHDSLNNVVRPDVLPLVAALNDTTATISTHGILYSTHGFNIYVDRDNAIMVFSIKVPVCWVNTKEEKLDLCIYSIPDGESKLEFDGRRLSDERAPRPNGLGEGLRKGDAASRTFRKSLSVLISKDDAE